MKANNTYETIIKNKLDQVKGPDTDIMWSDMKGILDIHMPEKKKRRIFGWWFFDGNGMYIGIAILITLGTLTGYRILKNKENIVISSEETQSLKKSSQGDTRNEISSDNNQKTSVANTENLSTDASTSTLSDKTIQIKVQKSTVNSDLSPRSDKTNKNISQEDRADRLSTNKFQLESGNSTNRITVLNNSDQSEIAGTTSVEQTVSLYNSERFNSLLTIKPQLQHKKIKEVGNKKPASEIAKLNQPQKKGWVIGGSFNYHVPFSSQQNSMLNIKGKKGNLADYLPSIYVQYHLNDKVYLQSEIQYSTPQHTPNHVLFDEWNNQTTHQKEENVVYLDKLYYVNIPVTLHYSPLKNVQVGSGIQISHLIKSILTDEQAVWQNGMEGWEKTVVNSQIYSKSPGSYSNNGSTPARIDTALQNFRSNDFRLVLDANYNFGKLNFGFNLNMGLTNYLNIKDGINSIHISDRNEDLKIYLRYNLWDQRKKIKH